MDRSKFGNKRHICFHLLALVLDLVMAMAQGMEMEMVLGMEKALEMGLEVMGLGLVKSILRYQTNHTPEDHC